MADLTADLDSRLRIPLRRLIADAPGTIEVFSGYRSTEHQAELYAAAVRKYGPDRAHHWVARPGTSKHNKRLAADLRYSSDHVRAWAHAHAADYGLRFPMPWEDWHIEPIDPSGPIPVETKDDDDMTPDQEARLARVEQKLDETLQTLAALTANRPPDHSDRDKTHIGLADILTAVEGSAR